MIGIDTNVLVRLFFEDDQVQTMQAKAFVVGLHAGEPAFVSAVVLVEMVWVLERSLGVSDFEIVVALRYLLSSDAFVVESERQVFIAMKALERGEESFADALIVELALARGCPHVVTFDKKAARRPGFRLL